MSEKKREIAIVSEKNKDMNPTMIHHISKLLETCRQDPWAQVTRFWDKYNADDDFGCKNNSYVQLITDTANLISCVCEYENQYTLQCSHNGLDVDIIKCNKLLLLSDWTIALLWGVLKAIDCAIDIYMIEQFDLSQIDSYLKNAFKYLPRLPKEASKVKTDGYVNLLYDISHKVYAVTGKYFLCLENIEYASHCYSRALKRANTSQEFIAALEGTIVCKICAHGGASNTDNNNNNSDSNGNSSDGDDAITDNKLNINNNSDSNKNNNGNNSGNGINVEELYGYIQDQKNALENKFYKMEKRNKQIDIDKTREYETKWINSFSNETILKRRLNKPPNERLKAYLEEMRNEIDIKKIAQNETKLLNLLHDSDNRIILRNILGLKQCNWKNCKNKTETLLICQCGQVYYCSEGCGIRGWHFGDVPHKFKCTANVQQ